MSKDQRGRKYVNRTPIGPPKHAGRIINVQSEASVNDVINNALGIIKQQVDALAAKSRMGGSLPDVEVKNLRTYIQSLVELSREDRERTKHDGVEDWIAALSTDELVQMIQGQLGQNLKNNGALDASSVPVDEKETKE